jgi:hypothetical protein
LLAAVSCTACETVPPEPIVRAIGCAGLVVNETLSEGGVKSSDQAPGAT